MNLNEIVANHRVIVCVGSGGVGKTTTAAALAVHSSLKGKRVLCLTIDPAKRLANSLGLEEMTAQEKEVSSSFFLEQGLECSGALSVMMLDSKATFDDLVRQYAPSEEAARRILRNRLYQYISTSFAGTQEYMALEKLRAVRADSKWDQIILDTPPTSNAIDFFEAPEKLASTLDSPAIRWFADHVGGHMGRGTRFMLQGLARFTGAEFLRNVSEFVTDLGDLFGGFRNRALEAAEIFRGRDSAFVVVASPQLLPIREALFLSRRLTEMGARQWSLVINGVHAPLPEVSIAAETIHEVQSLFPDESTAESLLLRMKQAFDDERKLALLDQDAIQRLRQDLMRWHSQPSMAEVPALEEDVHDLSTLVQIGKYLTGEIT